MFQRHVPLCALVLAGMLSGCGLLAPRVIRVACCALVLAGVLSGLAGPAAAQPAGPTQPESEPVEPGAPPAIASDEDLPLLPETTVIGRPSPDTGYPAASPVVSATRTPIRSGDVGSSMSVITDEQIRAKGQTNVAEVLRGLPGVDVVQQGGPGRVTSLFLRGGSSEHTKVLLDGLPLNDPITPGRSFDFSTLSVDNIERIEILRGPQSTLYGSDAIGGVVNIITRRGQGPPSGRLGATGGSFGTSHESGSVSGSNCDFHYALSGSYFDTDGFSAADERLPGNTENDAFRLGTLGGRTGWTPYENFDVDFVFRYNRGTAEIDDGGGPFMDDPNERNFTEQAFARTQLRYATLDDLWEQTLAFNFADHNRRTIDPTDALHPSDAFFSRFNSQLHMLDWQHNLLLLEGNTLTVGAAYADETGASSFTGESAFGPFEGDTPEQSLRNTGVYVQDQVSLGDRWFTTLGARQDHYSRAGTADTYRATSLYRLAPTETALRGSIGTGFKAPTLFQLFDAFSGNLGLLPEESKGWDVGLEQPLGQGRLVIGGTYFRNDFENLIDFDPSSFRFFNVGRALATGVELNGLYLLSPATSLIASYTYTRTRDRDTGLSLLRRPRNKAGLTLNRLMFQRRGNINVSAIYVDSRDDVDFAVFPSSRVSVRHYILVNAAATYDLGRSWQLLARVDNLLDEQYQEVFGFGTAGISGYGGLNLVW